MRYLILALLLLTACGDHVIKFSPDNYSFTNTSVPQVGKRLIYLHGLRKDHSMLQETREYAVITNLLKDAGWQVVEFDIPYTYDDMFNGGGKAYSLAYIAKLDQVMRWADQSLGKCNVNIIGGESFGGLHALMGAGLTPYFNGYFADIPVTKVETLREIGFKAPYFDPFTLTTELSRLPGYIDYGNQDTVTIWQYTAWLINSIGLTNLTYREYAGMGHEVHDLTPIAQWLLSKF